MTGVAGDDAGGAGGRGIAGCGAVRDNPRVRVGAAPRPRLTINERPAAPASVLRRRLAEACALEDPPPETFGFRFETAARCFRVTSFFYRRWFRVECAGIDQLPAGPFILVANHGSHV